LQITDYKLNEIAGTRSDDGGGGGGTANESAKLPNLQSAIANPAIDYALA
jgi:hypothetical protein